MKIKLRYPLLLIFSILLIIVLSNPLIQFKIGIAINWRKDLVPLNGHLLYSIDNRSFGGDGEEYTVIEYRSYHMDINTDIKKTDEYIYYYSPVFSTSDEIAADCDMILDNLSIDEQYLFQYSDIDMILTVQNKLPDSQFSSSNTLYILQDFETKRLFFLERFS